MHDAQAKRNKRMEECREIEFAMSQARPNQVDFVQREFPNRRAACQDAQAQASVAETQERILENELLDMEAAFAQDELLVFIKKGKYAFHPLNLANAMAGLPYGIDVPFLGVSQSHARSSRLESPGWPSYAYQVFETIKSIWERSKRSSISISHCEFFQQEIKALPKKVLQTHPTIGPQKVDNYVRTHLSDNWWCLQQAIEKSVQITDDPRPMPFIIASNFNKFVGKPKTYADIAAAKAKRISD